MPGEFYEGLPDRYSLADIVAKRPRREIQIVWMLIALASIAVALAWLVYLKTPPPPPDPGPQIVLPPPARFTDEELLKLDVKLPFRADRNGDIHATVFNGNDKIVDHMVIRIATERWVRHYNVLVGAMPMSSTKFPIHTEDPGVSIRSFTVKSAKGI